MKSFIITCILAGVLISSEVALTASNLTDTKIGDIATFKGEVLIRTQKNWKRLKKVPYPLYATDKVVTRRGRAEVLFVDGGRLRLDTDTNISIHQLQEDSTKNTNQKVTLQQVNILVGKVWFDVKIKQKGHALKFKTPTMTASIRGTQGGLAVAPDGSSKYGLSSGKAIMSGQFSPLQDTGPPDFQESLPQSDPLVDNSPPQQTALAAVIAAKRADQSESAAKAQKDNAAITDIKARAQASAATIKAAYDSASSDLATLDEIRVEEARIYKISNKILNQQIQDSQAAVRRLRGLKILAEALLREIDSATEENKQMGLAKLEEIEIQAKENATSTKTMLLESFDNLGADVFSLEAIQEGEVKGAQTLESEPEIQQPSMPTILEDLDQEIINEGDIESRTEPSPSQ